MAALEEEKKTRKPADGRFRQQRLPAWQPVLTPKTVLPTLIIVGILFTPIGGLLYWSTNRVDEIMLNYSYCGRYENPVYMASSLQSYRFSDMNNYTSMEYPAYHVHNETSFLNPEWKNPNNITVRRCTIDFTVPKTMKGPIFLYYRLTNFYQNHRQYIKNYDPNQLLGNVVSRSTLSGNCDPLATAPDGRLIYPCGLIANSMFNDTISNFTRIDGDQAASYTFQKTGIAWPTDKQKYRPTQYATDQIAPPPNWSLRYPNGTYDDAHPPPDLSTDEAFMVWMHVAALPDFRKIWGRNDQDDLVAGRWRVSIDMNFDTLQYDGTKWLVLSTTTPLGGRNPYLGIAYMAIGALCLLLGAIFAARHLIKPRKLGDPSYLSWNQPGGGLPSTKRAHHLHKE
ncbi:cell division control protein 50 [Radiomyces spectabilis]|uniref:cell division control protein 50 n=1 Tax=Radiomyces spectabilis TaxID=64574 RepID=UPI00221E8E83|nr:cell division control protein 50 [Radiomyces spectabilis]KAI8372765.1 cell division control protein 50 [Radiomyces spectabilis]